MARSQGNHRRTAPGKKMLMENVRFKQLWKMLYAVAVAVMIAALVFGQAGRPFVSDVLLASCLVLYIVSFVTVLAGRSLRENEAAVLWWCYAPFALLTLTSMFAFGVDKCSKVFLLGWTFAFVVPFAVLTARCVRKLSLGRLKAMLRNNAATIVIIVVFVLLCLPALNVWAACDSYDYFAAVQRAVSSWNLTFEDANSLRLVGHQSYSATVFYLVGGMLTPHNALGLRLINVLLAVIAIACFADIVRHIPKKVNSNLVIGISTGVFAFNPLILGTIYEINTDMLAVCFYIYMLWAFLRRHSAIFVFSTLLLVFSKESSLFVLGGFGLGVLVVVVYQFTQLRNQKRLQRHAEMYDLRAAFRWNLKSGFVLLIGGCVAILPFLVVPSWADMTMQYSGFNTFTFNMLHGSIITKELFFLNFNWLLIGIALLFAVVSLVSDRRSGRPIESSRKWKQLSVPLVCSYCFFLLFNYCFFTYCIPRYLILHVVVLSLAFAWTFGRVPYRVLSITVSLSAMTLLLVQNFLTIDPLMLRSFRTVDVGRATIVTTKTFTVDDGALTDDVAIVSERDLCSSAAYNRQYAYFGGLFDASLEAIDYNQDTLVIVAPVYGSATNNDLFGGWAAGGENRLYYDEGRKRITRDPDCEMLNLRVLNDGENISADVFTQYNRIYLFYFPYRLCYDPGSLLERVDVEAEGEVSYRGWEAEWYLLDR